MRKCALFTYASLAGFLIVARPEALAAQQADMSSLTNTCDARAIAKSETELRRLQRLRSSEPNTVSAEDIRAASADYLARAEACYQTLYGSPADRFDDGGLVAGLEGFVESYNTSARKWGVGSPYSGGQGRPGPGIAGGTVTYSYMANGVNVTGEGIYPGASANTAISSLPGFQACFLTDIDTAFGAWSAVANIRFVQAADNSMPFNAAGATGDIRIGAHVFDGPFAVLAHAYFPPPNGVTAAGDIHFDGAESWSCNAGPGVFDIGIVAAHEIGHAIGLGHEPMPPIGNVALMNPFYNPAVATGPIADDIAGARSIYGSATTRKGLAIDFGALYGIWVLQYGVGWTNLHSLSPEAMVTADLDGNGIEEVIVDFGSVYGVWAWFNNATWLQLYSQSPTVMTTGDLDNDGRGDFIGVFPLSGIRIWYNNTVWFVLHPSSAEGLASGDLDGNGRDELIVDFGSGFGVWVWLNNTGWFQLHALSPSRMVTGDIDNNGKDEAILGFPGSGIWSYWNNTSWSRLHTLSETHLATGDIDADGKDDIVVDFGAPFGIWTLFNGGTWLRLHSQSSEDLVVGDLDGNGVDDVTVDFGTSAAVWAWINNAGWVRIHTVSPEIMTIGHR
jgi:hypothetical protein